MGLGLGLGMGCGMKEERKGREGKERKKKHRTDGLCAEVINNTYLVSLPIPSIHSISQTLIRIVEIAINSQLSPSH